MSIQFKGQAFIFGVRDMRPIVNAPGPVRVRMRAGKPATGTVRTASGFEHYILQPADGLTLACPEWKLGIKTGDSCKS